MNIIKKYFPELTTAQLSQIEQLFPLYKDWNSRINVISRKDIDHLFERHILHSLSIAKVIEFLPGTRILDAGTGGGFPGIPLAILFPEVKFDLADSVGKKIHVVKAIADSIGLKNVSAFQSRVEEMDRKYDFIVSRAVTALPKFYAWVHERIKPRQVNTIPNGILYLKGGDIDNELSVFNGKYTLYRISDFFDEPFFDTKLIIHVPTINL